MQLNHQTESDQASSSRRSRRYSKWKVIGFLGFIGLSVLLILLKTSDLKVWLKAFLEWVRDSGLRGMATFVLIYTAAAILFMPIVFLSLGAGFIYSEIWGPLEGVGIGSLLVLLGSLVGSLVSMPLGRYVFRNYIVQKAKTYEKFLVLEEVIKHKGFKLVMLWRLPPFMPFSIFNYFMGVTSISFRDYALASVGMVPGVVAEVYFGSTISSLSEAFEGNWKHGKQSQFFFLGGFFLIVLVFGYISYEAKKKIDEMLETGLRENS